MSQILVGILQNVSELRTEGGSVHLTRLLSTTGLEPRSRPILSLREHEGQVAVVSGTLVGDVLFDTTILEILPPVASRITRNLLDENVLSLDDLDDRAAVAFAEIVGDPEDAEPDSDADRPKCALVVGHRQSAQGAAGGDPRFTEFEFNSALAPRIRDLVANADVEIVFRDDASDGYSRLPRKINELAPDFVVSLHCNSFSDARANGTEMLYFQGSETGHRMARILQDRVLAALGTRNRFTKSRTASERGGHLLSKTLAPCVIAEPFFLSHPEDVQRALANEDQLVAAYAAGIDEISDSLF